MTSQPPLEPAQHWLGNRFLMVFGHAIDMPDLHIESLRDGRWPSVPKDVKRKVVAGVCELLRLSAEAVLTPTLVLLNDRQYTGLKKAVEKALGRRVPPMPPTRH